MRLAETRDEYRYGADSILGRGPNQPHLETNLPKAERIEVGILQQAGGAALYVAGVVVTTVAYHVPRNDRLERVDPSKDEELAYWAVYLREWVRLNHVRTIAPLLAGVLFVVSLVVG